MQKECIDFEDSCHLKVLESKFLNEISLPQLEYNNLAQAHEGNNMVSDE